MFRILLGLLFTFGLGLPLAGCENDREAEIETPAGETEIEREYNQPDTGLDIEGELGTEGEVETNE